MGSWHDLALMTEQLAARWSLHYHSDLMGSVWCFLLLAVSREMVTKTQQGSINRLILRQICYLVLRCFDTISHPQATLPPAWLHLFSLKLSDSIPMSTMYKEIILNNAVGLRGGSMCFLHELMAPVHMKWLPDFPCVLYVHCPIHIRRILDGRCS